VSSEEHHESVTTQWAMLRSGAGSASGLEIPSMPLGTTTAAGPIRLAVGEHEEPRLLLPLTAMETHAGIDAEGALAVSVSSFMQYGQAHRFLDLICHSRELEHVFGEVVDEIVSRVANGVGCIEAARTTLNDFRALLATRRAPEISRSRVAGLIAELVILNRLLDVSQYGWRAWMGPTGDRHDFRSGGRSLEVKASLTAGSAAITINGLEQLEPPSGGKLHLAHFVLEPASGGLLTIAGLGGRALAQADDPSGVSDLLACVGCSDIKEKSWNRYAFRVESEKIYLVDGDFPRLIPSSLARGITLTGVADVSYRVDLSCASACQSQPDEINRLVRALAK